MFSKTLDSYNHSTAEGRVSQAEGMVERRILETYQWVLNPADEKRGDHVSVKQLAGDRSRTFSVAAFGKTTRHAH